ncbi:hypothetical protein PGB28_14055 [Primorskyibacter aestuariivivens]|uniref:hypothetical protein n=1 Tax=Primorskyibacter aestuariivivens TaxID=1888912 RepID=UPI0022FFEBB0|nr:hypothetical protein [Primorskyibacter aestuariivivens]MDA7429589.1 hypothetical protein [Primorskyibacter aestuariivivens]
MFPKDHGAAAYELTGVAALCDWVVLSDRYPPEIQVRISRNPDGPRSVFVSMRNPVAAIRHFYHVLLPKLEGTITLVSGSEDVTLPRQIDLRWPPFSAEIRGIIEKIAASPKVRHWYAENLDSEFSDRVSPLPTGMVYPDNWVPGVLEQPDVPLLSNRPLRVLFGARTRPGPQWDLRRFASGLADSAWSGFVTHLTEEVPEPEFLRLMSEHAFVLCVEGGGLDPSPKAWQALQYGAIPIIRKSPLWEAYQELPCVTVDEWSADCLSQDKLKAWHSEMLPVFDSAHKRAKVFERLSLDFWWRKIVDGECEYAA